MSPNLTRFILKAKKNMGLPARQSKEDPQRGRGRGAGGCKPVLPGLGHWRLSRARSGKEDRDAPLAHGYVRTGCVKFGSNVRVQPDLKNTEDTYAWMCAYAHIRTPHTHGLHCRCSQHRGKGALRGAHQPRGSGRVFYNQEPWVSKPWDSGSALGLQRQTTQGRIRPPLLAACPGPGT